MAAPLVSALTYLLGPIAAHKAARELGVSQEAAPSPISTDLGALGSLYALYKMNTGTPEEAAMFMPRAPDLGYLDPDFAASMQNLYAERDRAMDYGYAYPQEDMVRPAPPGYIQPTEEELRGLGAPGGAHGGLAALLRGMHAKR